MIRRGEFLQDKPLFDALRWRFRWWLTRLAYPGYDCEDCVGTFEGVSACYCAYYGAVAPGAPPGRWHLLLRWVHKLLYPKSSYHTDYKGVDSW